MPAPARKRKASATAATAASTRKKKPGKAVPASQSSESPRAAAPGRPVPAAAAEDAIDVAALYESCVVDFENRSRALQAASPAQVWRALVGMHRDANDGDGPDNKRAARERHRWMQGCELLAVLVTLPEQGPTAGDFEFCDDAEVFVAVLETLLHPLQANAENDGSIGFWMSLSTMVQFVDMVWIRAQTCAILQSETLRYHSGASLALWQSMPGPRLLLELKQRDLELDYSKAVEHAAAAAKTPPIVVSMIDFLLRLFHGNQLKPRGDRQKGDGEVSANHQLQCQQWVFVHHALEFLVDAISITSSQRYLAVYLDSLHFCLRSRLLLGVSTFSKAHRNWFLAQQLLERIDKLLKQYPVALNQKHHDMLYMPLTPIEQQAFYHTRASILQKMCHRYYAELVPDLVYAGVGLLCTSRVFLRSALGGLQDAQLLELLTKMRLVNTSSGQMELCHREFLLGVLEEYIIMPPDAVRELSSFPLYPTEATLWDWTRIPPSLSALLPESRVLSLPKLSSARFLSFLDYLSRNFELMRLETAYEIRTDLVDAVRRLRPLVRQSMAEDEHDNQIIRLATEFSGWARMALELVSVDNDGGDPAKFKIIKVAKPLVGQKYPREVIAEISVDLKPCSDSLRSEWDDLGEHDNIFLLSIDASRMSGHSAPLMSEYHLQHGTHHRWDSDKDRRIPDEDDATFPERFGIEVVRGCTILQVRDEKGNVLSEPGADAPVGTKRIFRVALDTSQYVCDKNSQVGTALYDSFNLVVRRKGVENNFKAVLETIRGLMGGMGSINRVIPSWLQGVLLGHGDPSAANYASKTMREFAEKTAGVSKPDDPLDFGDTFVDESHLRKSFPNHEIIVDGSNSPVANDQKLRKSFRLRFVNDQGMNRVFAESYPFPDKCAGNPVPFTPVQVDSIRAGLSPGLCVVVGPPGTGKTDVAVQIIASLYHSFPTQRTIIITHSNAALNDIFQKVMARGDVDERYLLRLGSGERDLQVDSSHDFTKAGRVAFSLHRRNELLEKVQTLSESIGLSGRAERGVDGAPSYTCETAEYFYENHVKRRIRAFYQQMGTKKDKEMKAHFPFAQYFGLVELNLARSIADKYFDEIKQIFEEIAEYRPLELLRNQRQRTDYLLVHQARIVAMTCTHAAIARSHLIELGFEYDNVVVEEAGQMTEIETFIPLLLQKGKSGDDSSRLKRICLMGDHNQLPPVIKNMTFSTYSRMDQSMFARLIKLGVSYIQLDKQGRARPEISNLYSWRYKNLGNLDLVSQSHEYTKANAGLAHVFQLINVEDFQGTGESSPTPYFFQNLGEAEYAVALFQYLVLIGYPAEKISILTTYNGQKELIFDVLTQRCGPGTPLVGIRPHAVSTVDQYQGQQNDYVILSLVRTEKLGHLRDIRRLVVAVSRARLGLYVLCRQNLFASSHDLRRTFDQFADKPSKLQLVADETYPTERNAGDPIDDERLYEVDDATHLGNLVYQMQEELINQQGTE